MRTAKGRARGLGVVALCALLLALAANGSGAHGDTFLVSVAYDTAQGDQDSVDPALSGDGTLVAFKSRADNLVAGDTNAVEDIFVRNRTTGQTGRVSLLPDGNQFTVPSGEPAISLNGNAVTWSSGGNVYVRNLDGSGMPTGVSKLVSADSGGNPAGGSQEPALTSDGSQVVYWSNSSSLVVDGAPFTADVFLYDRGSSTTEVISVDSAGNPAAVGGDSYLPSVSGSGRYVTFESRGAFVAGDTNSKVDIYLRDRVAHTTTLVSHGLSGAPANDDSFEGNGGPVISVDGSTVAFASQASNLVAGDTNGNRDIFAWHRATDAIERVSIRTDGTQSQGDSATPAINNDGTMIAFESSAKLHDWDANTDWDVYVRQLGASPKTTLESLSWNGLSVSGNSMRPSLDGDGQLLAYHSAATQLVSADTNNRYDVFVHQLGLADTTSPTVSGAPVGAPNGDGWFNHDVVVHWTASDPQPSAGQPASPPDSNVTSEGHNQTVTSAPACDGNGNCATGTVSVSVDKTAPVVSATVNTPNASGWYNKDVVVGFSCSDTISGIASCPPVVVLSSEGVGVTVPAISRTATDRAGNTAVAAFAPVKIDQTAPSIVFTGSHSYGINATVSITCAATDALSGILTSTCASVNAPAYLFNVGPNLITATVTDKAGNSTTQTFSFTVNATTTGLESFACTLIGTSNQARNLCRKLGDQLDDARDAAAKGDVKKRDEDLRQFLGTAAGQVGKLITSQQMVLLARIAESVTG